MPAAHADPTPDYSLTVAARLCPAFSDIQANLNRNNYQETYSDLGLDSTPPYSSDDMDTTPVSPERESSVNAAGYGQCTALPNWNFTLGDHFANFPASPNVGNPNHISVVTSNGQTTGTPVVTGASTPELNDAGQYVDSQGNVVTDAAQAAQIPGATTITLTADQASDALGGNLWIQGGKSHTYADGDTDTNKFQLNADQPQFAKSDGTPLYSFGALRCITDDANGDNVEKVSLSANRVHGYCFAYYVYSPPKPGTITVVNQVTSPSGDGHTFNFNGNVSFTPGPGDENTNPFTVVAGDSGTTFARASTAAPGGSVWTVQQSPSANPGWLLTSLSCVSSGGSTFTYSIPSGGVNTRASINLAAGDDVTCTAVDTPLTALTVQKLDSSTQAGVAGAGFTLYQESNSAPGLQSDDAVAGTCTSAANGTCSVAGLAPGTYYWLETSAPTGYAVNPTPATVDVTTTNAGTAITTPITDDEVTTDLVVHKTDATTSADLAGAVFDLHADTATGDVVGSCTTDSQGLCDVGSLGFGAYVWVERTAPAGYAVNSNPVVVTISAATAGTSITSEVSDQQLATTLTVRKIDARTSRVLGGAGFDLHSGSATGPVVGSCTTDGSGLCSVAVSGFGTYYWVETTAPIGYLINDQPTAVTVDASVAGTSDPSIVATVGDTLNIITGGSSGDSATGVTDTSVTATPDPTTGGLSFTGTALSVQLGLELGLSLLVLGGVVLICTRRLSR